MLDAQSTTPTLQRGSFSIDVNGQPVDGVGLTAKEGINPLQRTIALQTDRLLESSAVNLRFATDLRTSADPCADDNDPANSLTILPDSRIIYDIDIGSVRSIEGALALLPRNPLVQWPAGEISPALATAGLQLGVLLTGRGQEPRFDTARGDDVVAFRFESTPNRAPGSPGVQLRHDGKRIDIVIDPAADLVALGRLIQNAPGVLVGTQAAVSLSATNTPGADSRFRDFANLPSAQLIKRQGDWRFNFPLMATNGLLPESVLLKLFVAPDWSGQRPIVTVYLNEQIVDAARAETSLNDLTIALPRSLLRFSNTLRVTLERGGGERYCQAADKGQAAQIMPGSGLILGDNKGVGFIGVARSFGSEGQVNIPQAAATASAIGPYLQLATKTLGSFGVQGSNLSVAFGTPPAPAKGGILRFETSNPGSLILSILDQADGADLRYAVVSPLAVLSAQDDSRTLLVQVSDAANLPQPGAVYLGNGSKALVANSGVVWQNAAPTISRSIVDQTWNFIQGILSSTGLILGIFAVVLIGVLISTRAILKSMFDRRHRRNAGQ